MDSDWIVEQFEPRKKFLDFVKELYGDTLLDDIGKDPKRWLEELDIIMYMVARSNIVGGVGIFEPPKDEPEFRAIGGNVFYYDGKQVRLHGLWMARETDDYSEEAVPGQKKIEWTRYKLDMQAVLKIKTDYKDINPEDLFPENVKAKGVLIKDNKRPIYKIELNIKGKTKSIYAKGSYIMKSYWYEESKPSYRLTNLAGAQKITSEDELEKTEALREGGINVPDIVAIYKSDLEDFLFIEDIEGKRPDKCFDDHLDILIKEDSTMLAKLCKIGFRKQGFTSFDDKVFDGKKLYMIDSEDIMDLYHFDDIDYKKIVLDESGAMLKEFKEYQAHFFKKMLKDAIYNYRNDMLIEESDKIKYIEHFYQEMNWKLSDNEISDLLFFEDLYQTYGGHISMMMDCD